MEKYGTYNHSIYNKWYNMVIIIFLLLQTPAKNTKYCFLALKARKMGHNYS